MALRRLPYTEGDRFAVPLEDGGYAIGLIAVLSSDRVGGLGYFFPPRFHTVPQSDACGRLRPDEAVLICQFGDLGIIQGAWPLIGKVRPWNRQEWIVTRYSYYNDTYNYYNS